MHKNTKLGWVGLGVMGSPMCGHLIAAGYAMSVYTRSKDKASTVLNSGADWCDSPQQVAEQSDVIFTMVGLGQEVRDIYLSENGLFATNIEDKVFIDMGTTAPNLTLELAGYADKNDASVLTRLFPVAISEQKMPVYRL